MTKLDPIRANLAALGQWRRWVRGGTAASGLVIAVVAVLAVVFVLDFLFQPNRAVRAIFFVGAAASVLLAWRKLAQTWLGRSETELDLALMVQRHERRMALAGDVRGQGAGQRLAVARDFAAALQFEGPQGAQWGSVRLEQLVIDDVAGATSWLNVFEGFSMRQIVRRACFAAAALVLVVAAAALYPGHARAFANRLILGAAHYPSRTVLAALLINGQEVALVDGVAPATTQSAEGQPVRFALTVAGELPDAGQITASTATGRNFEIELVRQQPTASANPPQSTIYSATLDRLGEPLTYQIELGDAWTDPAGIDLIELPVVECTLSPIPPEYVTLEKNKNTDLAGVRNIEALEGSQIGVLVVCKNKPLADVAITIDDKAYPLNPVDPERRQWHLESKGTPLAAIAKETRYKLSIADGDGLAPEHVIEGRHPHQARSASQHRGPDPHPACRFSSRARHRVSGDRRLRPLDACGACGGRARIGRRQNSSRPRSGHAP